MDDNELHRLIRAQVEATTKLIDRQETFLEGVIKVSESSAMEPERLGPSC